MKNYPERPKHQKVLQRIQNILVMVTAFLIFLAVLLELVTTHAHLFICIAYLLAALAYGAEIVILVLRAKKHQVHPADLVTPVIFGLLYAALAVKYLLGRA